MEPAFVLHRRKYRESSLIVEFLTETKGRLAAVAKGVTRRTSTLGQILQPTISLYIETRGKSELQTLINAERAGKQLTLNADHLYSVLYMNEIIMKLTGPNDPLPSLFEAYSNSLAEMGKEAPLAPILRNFECKLLSAVGLGLNLRETADNGERIKSHERYVYVADRGAIQYPADLSGLTVSGESLKALNNETGWAKKTAREARELMRYIINHHLGGEKLFSREIYASRFQAYKNRK